ncbi:MAG: thiamine pyrophosphate-dependent enzyme [Bacteroidia bacterium]|jgi:2-oxoisovalerate dehydrogenase E1 component|nr:thiamine pyrophosphate-dependent enzyme [Bacteroidia bacterium]
MVKKEILLEAYMHMCEARAMAEVYDANRPICKYVHSTSRGHEAIQLAVGMQLQASDFCSPYYRDESILLGMGISPYELMLQLLGKGEDPFSGGRTYYAHPSLKREGFAKIPHQSSATGMQAIPTTGMAHAVKYKESQGLNQKGEYPVVVCSFGDGSITEGEVSEAFQMAVLKELPIIYLVQDNDWGISASGDEMRAMDAYEYAAGFKGLKRMRLDGSDFVESYKGIAEAMAYVRNQRKPILVHAKVPLLGHHTSGVRKEWYRTEEDLEQHGKNDPLPKLKKVLKAIGIDKKELNEIEKDAVYKVEQQFKQAVESPDPDPSTLENHVFAPSGATIEKGIRTPEGKEPSVMVDAALHAVDELMAKHPECLFYGQDVGARLGGVFREAATLAAKYGNDRVFNTPIQEAYIVGSTVGMSAVGVKPIVEIQFADYVWTGVNQLVCEITKSSYLTMGKYPVSCIIRIPIGAYGGGGPYHSGSIESTLLTLKGIKIAYPSNAADMKGLMKAAYYDGNPVIMLEHKGLYWSKNPGTEAARCIEPDEDYVLPLGKANTVLAASQDAIANGESCCIITWGMGVYWSTTAAKQFSGQVEVVDLRTLQPLDETYIQEAVKRHGKCLIVTEEALLNSFAESLAGRISQTCFTYLDAPVQTIGAKNVPAVPLNMILEAEMLPNADKVASAIAFLLNY